MHCSIEQNAKTLNCIQSKQSATDGQVKVCVPSLKFWDSKPEGGGVVGGESLVSLQCQ